MITVYDEAGYDKKNYTDLGGCYSPLRNSSCLRDLGRGEREAPPSRPPLFPFPLSVPITLALMPPSDKTFFIQHWLTQK